MYMTEKEYIHAQALETIRAGKRVLSDLVPANLKDVMTDDEVKKVFKILGVWDERLSQKIITKETN